MKTFFAAVAITSYAAQAVELLDWVVAHKYDGVDQRDLTLDADWTLRQNRAQAPEVYGWFKGDTYMAKTRQDKLADLWDMVTDDDTVSPISYADFPLVFSQLSNGSFC